MTPKQRLEAVFSGKTPDRVPFAPFAELIPRAAFDWELRRKGMGYILHHSSVQERCPLPQVEFRDPSGGKELVTRTRHGEVSEAFSYRWGASNDGYVQTGYMIRQDADYRRALCYLEELQFTLDQSQWELTQFYLGQEGLAHAWSFEPPYMGAQYYLGYEKWVYDQLDRPELFTALTAGLEQVQQRRMEQVLRAPERLVNIGNLAGNFSPEAFRVHMLPYLQKYGGLLRQSGRWPTLHGDASNLGQFKELIAQSGVKIIEAFTPPPVGDLSLAEARACWGESVTIWINFPEVVLQEGYDQTLAYTKELLCSDPCPNKLIGFTEMGFVGANASRAALYVEGLHAILDAIEAWGRYE